MNKHYEIKNDLKIRINLGITNTWTPVCCPCTQARPDFETCMHEDVYTFIYELHPSAMSAHPGGNT